MTLSGSAITSLMPTATWFGCSGALPTACGTSSEFTPSHSSTTSAVISSPPARTPVTRPSVLSRASTAMPWMNSAPASSAWPASHGSNRARSTEYDS